MESLMKRFVLCTLVLLCVVSLTNIGAAQSKIAVGGYAGLNIATLSMDPEYISLDSRTGLMVGGFAEFELAKMFYLEAGLAYVQNGAAKEILIVTATLKEDYLQIPVHAKVKFHLVGSSFTPYIYVGLNAGFLLNSEVEGAGVTLDTKDSIASTNFAADFGVGGELAVGPAISLFATVGYSWGFTDIDKTDYMKTYTRAIPIAIGVRFAL
jgi:hypothetical protein